MDRRSGSQVCTQAEKNTTFRQKRQKFSSLSTLKLAPGQKQFFPQIHLTQKKGFNRFNLACYCPRKYQSQQEKEPWYLLTNLGDIETTVRVYKQRFGIEAMFRDYKSGGYNLEGSQASPERLVRLILLIAIALTAAWLEGEKVIQAGKSSYLKRPHEAGRQQQRASKFSVGLSAHNWIVAFHQCQELIEELLNAVGNKRRFYRQGLKAITLIQQPL